MVCTIICTTSSYNMHHMVQMYTIHYRYEPYGAICTIGVCTLRCRSCACAPGFAPRVCYFLSAVVMTRGKMLTNKGVPRGMWRPVFNQRFFGHVTRILGVRNGLKSRALPHPRTYNLQICQAVVIGATTDTTAMCCCSFLDDHYVCIPTRCHMITSSQQRGWVNYPHGYIVDTTNIQRRTPTTTAPALAIKVCCHTFVITLFHTIYRFN